MDQFEFVCERLEALEEGGPARAALRLVARASDAPRPPMTVLLAIDVSSSMTGEPLAYVRRAAVELVDLLGPQDRLGVVTFSAVAREAAPVEPLTTEHAARVRGVISALRAERGTNFEAALDEIARRMPPAGEDRRTVVFLTDGYPSEGERRASVLAARVEREGWGLSALGFGEHFHEELVRELSHAGSGQVRFIEEPGLSRRAFALALGHHALVALESARVSIVPTGGASIQHAWGATPSRPRGVGLEYELASLVRGEAFTFALDVTVGEGAEEDGLDVSLDAIDAQGRPVRRAIGWEAPSDVGLARLAYWSARLDDARRAVERVGAPEAVRQLEWLRADALADLGAEPSAAADALLEQVEDDIEALRRARPKTIARRLQADAERGERTLFTSITSRSARDSIAVFADSASEPLGSGRARLEIVGEGNFALPDDAHHVLIGRSSDADIVVSDPSVSRRHARIGREAGTFYITDLGSTVGTFVDGDRVTTAALTGVVRVQFGHVRAVFRMAPARAETPGISELRAIRRNPADTRAPLAAQARVVHATPCLELPDGSVAPLDLPLVLIGSDALCDIVLDGSGVAPRHAVLSLEGGKRVLRAASACSVEVDGTPVTLHVLADGESITCAGVGPLVYRGG